MPDKKSSHKNIRKINKLGSSTNYSYYITIPIEIIRKYKWQDNQRVVVKQKTINGKKAILITDY